MKLFVRIAPNNTAWTSTLESFLESLGFTLAHEVRPLHCQRSTRDSSAVPGFFTASFCERFGMVHALA